MYEVVVDGEFSAAHSLKLYDGTWEPRHGHDFLVQVRVRAGKLDSMGVVVDFEDLKPRLKSALGDLEGRFLNDHPAFSKLNPSTENIARVVHDRLAQGWKSAARIVSVTVYETPDARAAYYPGETDGR